MYIKSECFCDKTNDCDPFCCCDSNCPSASKLNWENNGNCIDKGFTSPSVNASTNSYTCDNTTNSFVVPNLQTGMKIKNNDNLCNCNSTFNMFCINKINDSLVTSKYTTKPSLSAAEITAANQKSNSLNIQTKSNSSVNSTFSNSYQINQSLVTSQGLAFAAETTISGVCGFNKGARLNINSTNTCYNTLPCTQSSIIDPKYYKNLQFNSYNANNDLLTPTVNTVSDLAFNAGSCNNVVSSLTFNIKVNCNSSKCELLQVDIEIQTTNISVANNTTALNTKLTAKYNYYKTTLTNYTGNQGYRTGNEVLLTTSITTPSPVTFKYILGNQNGNCIENFTNYTQTGSALETAAYQNQIDVYSLKIGHNTMNSCIIQKNLAQLQTFCTNTGNNILQKIINDITNSTYQAYMFGDENTKDTDSKQFVLFDLDKNVYTASTWDTASNTCKIVNNVVIYVFYSQYGSVGYSSKKIVGVKLGVSKGSFTYKNTDTSVSQYFSLNVSVNYVNVAEFEQTTKTESYPYPSFYLFKLPSDIMYPFDVSWS